MKKRQKKIVLLLSVIVTVSIILSMLYIHKELHHECSQQECPICAQLKQAQELLSQVKGIVISIIVYLLGEIVLQSAMIKNRPIFQRHSPVTLKVKLLN